MFDEMLTERQRAKLRADECAVWAGKPKPRFWGNGSLFLLFFGTFWSAITGVFVWQVGIPLWREFAADPGWAKFWPALGFSAFLTPFVCVGIGTLFSPLWRYIGLSRTVWVVTNRRLLRFAPFHLANWTPDELTESVEDDMLSSLYPDDFPFAQSALKRLDDSVRYGEDEDGEDDDDEEEEERGAAEILSAPPKRVKLEMSAEDGLRIRISQFSWGFIPLAVFTAFWGGGSLGGIYIRPLIQGKPIELGTALFGIPFLLGTIFLVSMALWLLGGKTEVVRNGDSLTVFRGVFAIGLRRRYDIPAGAKFDVEETSTQVNRSTLYKLVMRDGPNTATLMRSTRYNILEYIAAALNA